MKDFFDQIYEYKNKLLSNEDRAAFEKEMQSNEQLKIAVENFDLIEMIGEATFEEETIEIINKKLKKKSKDKTSLGLILKFVVAILILGALIFGIKHYLDTQERNMYVASIMDEHTPPQVLNDRSVDGATNDQLLLAKQAFSKRDYEASKAILLSLELTTDSKDEINFLLAHIYFYERKFDLSREKLALIRSKEFVDKSQSLQELLDKI